jgi:hypothetical protein
MARKQNPPRLPVALQTSLQGADWRWELGTKHWKLYVEGKLAGIWPLGRRGARQETDRRPMHNMRSQIRRARRKESA